MCKRMKFNTIVNLFNLISRFCSEETKRKLKLKNPNKNFEMTYELLQSFVFESINKLCKVEFK